MNRLKFILTGVIFLLSFQLKAQIENEIKSYTDSTEILVKNGRQLLLNEIRNNRYRKSSEVFSYLTKKTAAMNCQAFSFNEYLMVTVLVSDWNNYLKKARNHTTEKHFVCYKNIPSIETELYEEIIKYFNIIQKDLYDSGLSVEETELIDLYLLSLQLEENRDAYDNKIKRFRRKYPNSVYRSFINSYLPATVFDASLAIGAGATYISPIGNMTDYLDGGIGWQTDFDFRFKKMYLSLNMSSVSLAVTSNFNANSISFYPNEDYLSYLQGGLKGGYYLIRNNRVHVAPYAQVGWASLRSNKYKNSTEGNEISFFNSFFAGPGVHTQVKLFEYKGNSKIFVSNGYFSLKFDAGYNMITDQYLDALSGNMLYTSLTLIWGIGFF